LTQERKDVFYQEYARQIKSEAINLHLQNGKGVGFGRINTRLLGDTLVKFDEFYREVAYDSILGNHRGEIKLPKKEKDKLIRLAATEIVASKAASYSIIMRPFAADYNLFDSVSSFEKVASQIFNLISEVSDIDLLPNIYHDYSDFVIKSYQIFLEQIVNDEITIDLKWFSPQKNEGYSKQLNPYSANQSLINLAKLGSETFDKIIVRGKFTAINCKTAYFTFNSNDDETYQGYFDKLIRESAYTLNFQELYEVTIERKTIKEPGRYETRNEDTLIALYRITL